MSNKATGVHLERAFYRSGHDDGYRKGYNAAIRAIERKRRKSHGARLEAALMGEVPYFGSTAERDAELLLWDEQIAESRRNHAIPDSHT